MIVNFKIRNFGSVRDEQELSFEADRTTDLEDHYIINVAGYRLLKLGLIYGANASGKTTVLKALEFLRDLVLEPEEKKTDELDFSPFLFDATSVDASTCLAIEFIQNGVRYNYEVEFSRKAVIREKLDFFNPKLASVFSRTTNLENQFTEIKFGSKIKKDKTFRKALESNTLWNNTVLGGFLKTNIDFHELKEASDWFAEYLKPLVYTRTELEGYVTSMIEKKQLSKRDIVTILQKADLNISNISIEEEEALIPQDLIKLLVNSLNESDDNLKYLRDRGKVSRVNVGFVHSVGGSEYTLPIDAESLGTRRFYGFAGLLAMLIKGKQLIPIDELEASLHPDLYLHFLLSFLMNSKDSQLLATTHNREILGNRDVFRDDAIWFTDKDENCSTELYSLADFDTSVVRDTTNVLNAYKSGKLNGKPNLGDVYIELD